MNIILQKNNSEDNRVGKDITDVATVSGSLKNESSVVNPVILIESSDLASNVNYMTIPEFHRKYFVTDIVSVRNSLVEIHAHCDVIETYAPQIRQQRAIVSRQQNKWNLYLDDGMFKTYQNAQIVTKAFPAGFTNTEFVLAVAGSVNATDTATTTGGTSNDGDTV